MFGGGAIPRMSFIGDLLMVMKVLDAYHVIVKQNNNNTFSWELHYDSSGRPYKRGKEQYNNLTEAFQAGTHFLNNEYELNRLPHYEAT